ncbi:hypothetical protein [Salinisphaera sp. Q1T1-3]|uniref:hypothetical protein n=1 Tax=Salinisphaera sp. Q1T1-3 TaxID=2321229 RepID=UPI000E75B0DB|nr:hypothetical protein [Salinisphaera sp. Q1T1-3]RJS92746.1 hypothetical protein D3260_11035 [Salinisphaera sp. Q1T1-3]
MCGLCGALGGEDHWTAHLSVAEQADVRRRQRAYRIGLINTVLRAPRLTLTDFQSSRYVLAGATGKRAIVDDLGGIWQQAETMTGASLDPLDPEFLDGLGT